MKHSLPLSSEFVDFGRLFFIQMSVFTLFISSLVQKIVASLSFNRTVSMKNTYLMNGRLCTMYYLYNSGRFAVDGCLEWWKQYPTCLLLLWNLFSVLFFLFLSLNAPNTRPNFACTRIYVNDVDVDANTEKLNRWKMEIKINNKNALSAREREWYYVNFFCLSVWFFCLAVYNLLIMYL